MQVFGSVCVYMMLLLASNQTCVLFQDESKIVHEMIKFDGNVDHMLLGNETVIRGVPFLICQTVSVEEKLPGFIQLLLWPVCQFTCSSKVPKVSTLIALVQTFKTNQNVFFMHTINKIEFTQTEFKKEVKMCLMA